MESRKRKILFVVEGKKKEISIFNNLSDVFFKGKCEITPVPVPADMNIYMLFDVMKKDDFQVDVVEVLREKVPVAKEILTNYVRDDFSEVYFFFDFDEQTNNLHYAKKTDNINVLEEMLKKLDNETELGKLYISYPMVEAFRDFLLGDCQTANGSCFRARSDFGTYKKDSGKKIENNRISTYNFPKWKEVISCYIYRISCLFKLKNLNRDEFINLISSFSIFQRQMTFYKKNEEIFVLSCLPQFLIDYSEIYWNDTIKKRKKPINHAKCDIVRTKEKNKTI